MPIGGWNANTAMGGGPRASYVADPALQMALAANVQDLATGRAQADEKRRQLLLDYGDPRLARTFYGGDKGYIGSVAANPFSMLGRMRRDYTSTVGTANEELNQQNLWYGGFRAKTLADLAMAYTQQQADTQGQTQRALMDISDFLLENERQARDRRIAAELDAYNRAVQSQIPQG